MLSKSNESIIKRERKYHTFKGANSTVKELINSFGDDTLVYFDPDVDGMVAGYFVCKYLNSIGKRFKWYVNSNRAHGWSQELDNLKNTNIIAVDFLIPREKIVQLVDNCNTIISMDHHECENEFIEYKGKNGYGVVINNQYPFEEKDSRYLSGAGVVFEVLRTFNEKFETEDNRALVGLTLLSDVRNIENPLAHDYLYTLYNHKYNGYIGYLIEHTIGAKDYNFGVPRMDRNYVDFKFSPAINAALRYGKEEEVVNFFLGSGKLNLTYHADQKKLVESISAVIKKVDFSHLRICYFLDEDVKCEDRSVLSNFVGLVASRYLGSGRSVICYMISKDSKGRAYVPRASFRGNINGLEYRENMIQYINGVGHGSAFGIKGLKPSKQLFAILNKVCMAVEDETQSVKNIQKCSNLSIFAQREGKKVGEYNMYCLSQNRKYIKYTGSNIHQKRSGAKYEEYSVDGINIMCFDLNTSFDTGVILPMMERGFVYYYLQADV